jgi:fermentation-respiration switch protein FrsA (DUF1100 family)
MPVTIWYPSSVDGTAPVVDASVATGPFPAIAFSHGLRSVPDGYVATIAAWVRSGFVVIAPTFPFTNRDAAELDPSDVTNQPGDVSAALDVVLAASATAGDPLSGSIDPTRIIAAGHSEGAITTVGLFDECCRDPRLIGGVVLAGNSLGFAGAPSGAPAPMLFMHGDADRIVPYRSGTIAFREVRWPKAFVTLNGEGHIDAYTDPSTPAFAGVAAITTAFIEAVATGSGYDDVRQQWQIAGVEVDDQLTAR